MNIETVKAELTYRTCRSSGSGGQHVNKVSTKVELRFNLWDSMALDEAQKTLIQNKLKNRISKEGILYITNQESRSQQRNKKLCMEFFFQLLHAALRPVEERKPSRLSSGQKAARLRKKRQHAEKKKNRQKVNSQSFIYD